MTSAAARSPRRSRRPRRAPRPGRPARSSGACPLAVSSAGFGTVAVEVVQAGGDLTEQVGADYRAFPTDLPGVDPQYPVQPDLAAPAVRVPRPAADIHPDPAVPGLRGGIAVMVLAGQDQGQQPRPARADHQHRAVLPPVVILLEGDPGPDD